MKRKINNENEFIYWIDGYLDKLEKKIKRIEKYIEFRERLMKMGLFRTIDYRFQELGFEKTHESDLCVTYEKFNEEYNYTQIIELGYKASGYHLIHSYVKNVNSEGFNNGVGLTMLESKLCLKKMKSKGWKVKK